MTTWKSEELDPRLRGDDEQSEDDEQSGDDELRRGWRSGMPSEK